MAQRRHHYEQAFEAYLRQRRIPYVAVNEARKALLPPGSRLRLGDGSLGPEPLGTGPGPGRSIKSIDFVIYGDSGNLLVEIKGRKVGGRAAPNARAGHGDGPAPRAPKRRSPRLESWVTREDVESLRAWQGLFGPGFEGAFLFVYWCEQPPPDGLFQEIIEHRGRWYALRAVTVDDYAAAMRPRSPRWGTVHLNTEDFARLSCPFAPPAVVHALERGADPGPELPVFDPFPERSTRGSNHEAARA